MIKPVDNNPVTSILMVLITVVLSAAFLLGMDPDSILKFGAGLGAILVGLAGMGKVRNDANKGVDY